jgi:hypothetical protein
MFLNYFDVLMLKIIFLKIKIYYFNIFLNKKYFKNNHNFTNLERLIGRKKKQ